MIEDITVKKILYIDMDNVLVDFASAIPRIPEEMRAMFQDHLDDVPGIFSLMDPVERAIESYKILVNRFDTYILSTAPWNNPSAWSDKLFWVKMHLGSLAYKRLILTHHKNLNLGHFLIDDRNKHGTDHFQGEHILFGSKRFPDWPSVVEFLNAAA